MALPLTRWLFIVKTYLNNLKMPYLILLLPPFPIVSSLPCQQTGLQILCRILVRITGLSFEWVKNTSDYPLVTNLGCKSWYPCCVATRWFVSRRMEYLFACLILFINRLQDILCKYSRSILSICGISVLPTFLQGTKLVLIALHMFSSDWW